MTFEEIEQLRRDLEVSGEPPVEVLETHISWVLLGQSLAWKIKKPVTFSYLDFRTLEARYELCKRELFLNQRLAPEIYLAVSPVVKTAGGHEIGAADGAVIDFAVVMKRLDNNRLLSKALEEEIVTVKFMAKLAEKLARFHIAEPPETSEWEQVNELAVIGGIREVSNWLRENISPDAPDDLNQWTELADEVLNICNWRFRKRVQDGFIRDGHGDLHAGNIFFYEDDPIIFDCIEFNDSFRKLDVLSDIAFLCMDLDFFSKGELRKTFLETYQSFFPAILCREDVLIFKYYCLKRSSIRLKVLAAKESERKADNVSLNTIHQYYALTRRYAQQLRGLLDRYITFETEEFQIRDVFEDFT